MRSPAEAKTPLQKLLNLRQITAKRIAHETGLGYHAVQKTIKNQRHSSKTRKMIANFLNLDYEYVWGEQAEHYLRELIKIEIKKRTATTAHQLKQEYL